MEIEFDPVKNLTNQLTHEVSLSFAHQALSDPHRVDSLDLRRDYGEDRYICLCQFSGRVWVCVYTMRKTVYRIISLRKANEKETERYHRTPRGL